MTELERVYRQDGSGNWGWFTDVESEAGGSQPGVAITRSFSFAFDTPGLADGLTFWEPSADDVLLECRIVVIEEWDGTDPLGDFGAEDGFLLESYLSGTVDMTSVEAEVGTSGITGSGSYPQGLAAVEAYSGSSGGSDYVPAPLTGDPLKVWVTQGGSRGGDPPGGTAGTAKIIFVIATPEDVTP